MIPTNNRSWMRMAVMIGIGYALVGILFAIPVTHVRAWRLAAWIVSAIAFAVHIAHERFRLHNPAGPAARHVALAAAFGAFGLAVGANVHALYVGSTGQHRTLLLLSLGIWPIITGLPAFVVAFATNALLARTLGDAGKSSIEPVR